MILVLFALHLVVIAPFGYLTYRLAAFIFVVLAALTGFCVYRTCTRWMVIGSWRRTYGLATICVSSALLALFVVETVQDPMFSPAYLRAIWNVPRLGGRIHVDELRDNSVSVDLSGPQVTDAELGYLEALPRLRSLSLMNTRVTDAGLLRLKAHADLKQLTLVGTQFTDKGIGELKAVPNLKRLTLAGTQVTDNGIAELQQALPDLEIVQGSGDWD